MVRVRGVQAFFEGVGLSQDDRVIADATRTAPQKRFLGTTAGRG